MAISKQAPLEFKILHIALIVCRMLILVNSASVYSDTEGSLCKLKASPDFVASMECRFPEPVHYMQVDFYRLGLTTNDPPVTVVSCGDSCDLTSIFTGTLELRGAPTNYTLTLKVQSVPQIHAGKYRCEALSIKESVTVHGVCSVRAPNTGSHITHTHS